MTLGPSEDDTREEVKRRFGPAAQKYVESPDHARGASLDRLLEVLAPRPDWSVLDVATGGGHTALALAPHVREVVATDLTAAMLVAAERFLRERGAENVRFQEADAEALPFEPGRFDLVTCRIAPHHFPDCAKFVLEAARVVKPGGKVALIDNIVPEDPEGALFINRLEAARDPSHHWAYPELAWVEFFRMAGLEILHRERFRKALDFDRWAERMVEEAAARARLRAMLLGAAGAARESLEPAEQAGGAVRFYLTELMLVGSRGLAPPPTRRSS